MFGENFNFRLDNIEPQRVRAVLPALEELLEGIAISDEGCSDYNKMSVRKFTEEELSKLLNNFLKELSKMSQG